MGMHCRAVEAGISPCFKGTTNQDPIGGALRAPTEDTMNTTSLAIVRILCLAMLLAFAGCNKMDRNLADNTPQGPRVLELEARVRFLQAELDRVSKQEEPVNAAVPGGELWD